MRNLKITWFQDTPDEDVSSLGEGHSPQFRKYAGIEPQEPAEEKKGGGKNP